MDGQLNIGEILNLLPHRFPFLLVDRVLSRTGGSGESRVGCRAEGIKNVTFNEPFFTGHFPEQPIMPGVLQIEAMAQMSALAFCREGDPKKEFFIAAIHDAKFRRPVIPGDTLKIVAEIAKVKGQMIVANAEIRVEDQIVSQAQLVASVTVKKNP